MVMTPDELRRLIDRHAAALTLYARQWCAAPEDVVQEALLRLISVVPRDPIAWLYRAVRNAAISQSRAELRRRKREASVAQPSDAWFTPASTDVFDADAVRDALAKLPDEEREVIVLHVWGELTYEQIAEVLGVSPATVHRRRQAGLQTLRSRLEGP